MSNKGKKTILKMRYGKRCMLCLKKFDDLQFHHIKPLKEGGINTVENGTLLCENCHKSIHKYQYLSVEFVEITTKILINMEKCERGA